MRRIGWAGVLLWLGGCAASGTHPAAVESVLPRDAARPLQAMDWIRSELYFGIGDEHGNVASGETRWRAFLDAHVTPRFPDGLTVFDASGQWQGRDAQVPERLHTKVLVILHEDTPQRRTEIEAIRLAWKQLTGDQSVLWTAQAAEVSF